MSCGRCFKVAQRRLAAGTPGDMAAKRGRAKGPAVGQITWQCGRHGSPRQEHEWVKNKERELAEKTGVPWSAEHFHGNWRFLPYSPPACDVVGDGGAEEVCLVRQLLAQKGPSDYTSILEIAVETGLDLPAVVKVLKTMSRNGELHWTVNRTGKPVGVRLREKNAV
jgi:hypothetical protein